MSVNSSSSSNASLPPHFFPSSVNLYHEMHNCFSSTVGIFNITAFTITSVLLLLPLYVYVLYLGLQRWRQQRSNTTTSHSDVFTYHMVVAELMSVLGSTITCCGAHADLPYMLLIGICFLSMNMSGQMFFHVLTCAERYLAVVHPITYRSLREASGIRIRNITIGCVWVLNFAAQAVLFPEDRHFVITFYICSLASVITIVSFLSLSVLCFLIRPRPGDGGGGRQQVDQSKLRAFYTIMAILGVLLFRLVVNMISIVLYALAQLGGTDRCVMWTSMPWICLPTSLVLPLLFLHRADKLLCSKNHK